MHKLKTIIKYAFGKIGDDELLHQEYVRRFKKFVYPFETADTAIKRLSSIDRANYYKAAVEIRDNKIIKLELNEIARAMYFELAVNPESKKRGSYVLAAYEGALMFANKFYTRFQSLAMQDPEERQKAIEQANDSIEEILGNE